MTTITATEACEAMLEHHKRLGEELAGRADAVSDAVAAGRPFGAAVAGLVAYLAEELLPHAAAEEKTIYPAAARTGLAGTVEQMIVEHITLSTLGARAAAVTDGKEAAEQAQQIARLFTAHAARENDVLLPALLADKSADVAGLLEQMHDYTGHDHDPRPLRYQFQAQYEGEYTWDYLEAGPRVWRVRIGRTDPQQHDAR